MICPGSRNAPLTVAFSRHPGITCYSIPDERSAAFIALGLAQYNRLPAAVICTSGTAVLNLYPAICEAYYQQVPLVAITADRPPELIDQWDGQAIHQVNIFEKHILNQISMPLFDNEAALHGALQEVDHLIISSHQQQMPVHINVPFREPFYPVADESYEYAQDAIEYTEGGLMPEHQSPFDTDDTAVMHKALLTNPKTLVLLGSGAANNDLGSGFMEFIAQYKPVVIADVLSNDSVKGKMSGYDILLRNTSHHEALKPGLLISIGGAVVSKSLKIFLRNNKPALHIHIQRIGKVGNPFQTLTHVLRCSPEQAFASLPAISNFDESYGNKWRTLDTALNSRQKAEQAGKDGLSQLYAMQRILNVIPSQSMLHLSSSMPVRYATLFGVPQEVKVYCNRGTSGIDGSSSTAVGASLNYSGITTLITGDIAFFYDINAFWHKHLHNRLRIILLNNRGGGIFRLIDGPASLKELNPYFETRHERSAEQCAADFGFEYHAVRDVTSFHSALDDFFAEKQGPALLEIVTDMEADERIYKAFLNACL